MHEVEKEYREGIKKYVLDKGALSTFVEMPAVMERIYCALKTKNLDDMPLVVSEEGRKIDIIGSHVFTLNDDGTVNFLYLKHTDNSLDSDSLTIHIDEYGMDKSFYDCSPEPLLIDWFLESKRQEDGTIKGTSANGTNNRGSRTIEDHGSPFLYLDEPGIEEKSRLDNFKANREFYEVEYPKTKEWYAEKEEQILLKKMTPKEKIEYFKEKLSKASKEEIEVYALKYLKDQESQLTELHQKNEEFKKEIKRTREINHGLEGEISDKQKMLKNSLDLVERIKESPAGKIFFSRSAAELSKVLKSADLDVQEK